MDRWMNEEHESQKQIISKEIKQAFDGPAGLRCGCGQAQPLRLRLSQKRSPAKRARLSMRVLVVVLVMVMVMVEPPVQAFSVEDMAAVPELSHLVATPQLAQAHRTRVPVTVLHRKSLRDFAESGKNQILSNQLSRRRRRRG